MASHRVTYILDGEEHSRVFTYASTEYEAGKMAELGAKWKNINCDFQIVSIETIPTNWAQQSKSLADDKNKNCFIFKYDERDRCR